ncbi:MAG: SUMF1/EgtB/PvdO family nonheme iron enzyme [Planctomycetes bacterium]|mgnify:CR=1 FL=1|nr:SUMF1/EgtB/PvdO family nonheme iron enzyme [Planctomycetota bacterium]
MPRGWPWLLLLFLLADACRKADAPPTNVQEKPRELDAAARQRLREGADPRRWSNVDPAQPGSHRVDPRSGISFARIPAGEFTMGDEAQVEAKPAHTVRLRRDFLLATTELTIGQWRRYVAEFGGDPTVPVPPWTDDHPMPLSCVDAERFCATFGYRLPSEAEWERACTGGVERSAEPWATEAGMREHAWFHRNAEQRAHAVATRAPNAYGLHDMLGNLWEWCGENWRPFPYQGRTGVTEDPRGPNGGSDRVIRGGSWFSVPPATPRTRKSGGALERNRFFGCRPAIDLPE